MQGRPWGPGSPIRTQAEDREMRHLQSRFDTYDQGGGRALSRKDESRLQELQGRQRHTEDMNMTQAQVILENKRRAALKQPAPRPMVQTSGSRPEPIIRYVTAPPAPVSAASYPVYQPVSVPKTPAKPQYRRSATGRFVLDEPGKKRVLGRGKRSTILTSPQGDLGGGSDMDLRKPKLGG